jgi:hypothetical protein
VGEIPKKLGNLDCEAISDSSYNRRAEDGQHSRRCLSDRGRKRLRSRIGNLLQPRVIDLMSSPFAKNISTIHKRRFDR